jgi:hypothetical protein
MTVKLVAVNEIGCRIGEDSPKAVLTNSEVEMIFVLREETGWGYLKIAQKFEVSKSLIRNIFKGKCRCQHPARFKRCEE